ncbi:site-specific integrase [Mesoaciditoga lauensis]|uniref:site-specific integrase n=1 Tax=Mesoaciditoga lauensis TaxID=1495039 RepID=UPI000561D47A|nr:site-specific integrase [Mesoaciditoga lauensis]
MREVNPIKDIKKIRRVKRLMKKDGNYRDLLMFTLGINAGLRISDILNMKWKDLLMKDGRIKDEVRVKEKKTGKTKIFPLNGAVKRAIGTYMENSKNIEYNSYVFMSRKKSKEGKPQPISRVAAWQSINKYCKMAGIEQNVGTHTLRKTFGYHQYKNGTDIAMLQKMLNHSSPQVTLRYIGIEREKLNARYKAVEL